jgi:chemotaxis response regulator CheB
VPDLLTFALGGHRFALAASTVVETVLAQDEGSSVVFGMPREAVTAGVVNAVLGVEGIAPRLVALAREA